MPNPTITVPDVHVDDSVMNHLGDSIACIIFQADTVNLLSLSVEPTLDSLNTKSANADSVASHGFHGCYVKQDYGVLSKSEVYPLLLILSDKENYSDDAFRIKSPFIPDVALSFKKGKSTIDIVFSFTGGQMFIFTEKEDKLYFKYNYERLTMKFFQSYLKDERITEYLNL